MAEETNISWCDSTMNFWLGCTRISPGCDSCYAAVSTPARAMEIKWGVGEPRHRTSPGNWKLPIRWQAAHREFFRLHGRRRRVFASSLSDFFDNEVDPEWRREAVSIMRQTPDIDWLVLTKRIGLADRMLTEAGGIVEGPNGSWEALPNLWLGATVVNAEEAQRDIPKLLNARAYTRWLSMEPMLGPVYLPAVRMPDGDELGEGLCWVGGKHGIAGIDWIVVGGESGPDFRRMDPSWARMIKAQCQEANVPCLVKQMSGPRTGGRVELDAIPEDLVSMQWPPSFSRERQDSLSGGRQP